jgi:hypothetical protein
MSDMTIGKALARLWSCHYSWGRLLSNCQGYMKRFALRKKTLALIEHDRILRGEV